MAVLDCFLHVYLFLDDLLDYITGLVGICLLPETDDSTYDASNELSEDEDSDEIIIVFCDIRTR